MTLHGEVERFRVWAVTLPMHERPTEWESEYVHWADLRQAVVSFLGSASPARWSAAEVEDLIYAIARDNEAEVLADEIARNSDALLCLANHAIASLETDAKWQLAARLGDSSERFREAEVLLLRFTEDENEYVGRRALLALGSLKSAEAERLAERAWQSGDLYQRIAALQVLKDIASDKLQIYVHQAIRDGSRTLFGRQERLSRREHVRGRHSRRFPRRG